MGKLNKIDTEMFSGWSVSRRKEVEYTEEWTCDIRNWSYTIEQSGVFRSKKDIGSGLSE